MINIADYTMKELNSILSRSFGKFKNGRSRKVYIDKINRIVYKLPIISSAKHFNTQEYKNYLAYVNGTFDVHVAACELFYTKDNIPIIVMEFVADYYATCKTLKGLPEWAKNGRVDDHQIGFNDRGDIVCYDCTTGV